MGWRASACADGVGFTTGYPTPLGIVSGQPIEVSFAAGVDVTGRMVRAEIRTAPGGRLLLDMAPYCTADSVDPTLLRISVPADVSAALTTSGYYDVWVDAQRIALGPAMIELAISILPPRTIVGNAWTPILVMDQPFVRTIDTTGMLPADESLASDPDYAPMLTVYELSGAVASAWHGLPTLTVQGAVITLNLTMADVQDIGVGRFTYTLHACNTLHEPRTLLAGVLQVVEDGGA